MTRKRVSFAIAALAVLGGCSPTDEEAGEWLHLDGAMRGKFIHMPSVDTGTSPIEVEVVDLGYNLHNGNLIEGRRRYRLWCGASEVQIKSFTISEAGLRREVDPAGDPRFTRHPVRDDFTPASPGRHGRPKIMGIPTHLERVFCEGKPGNAHYVADPHRWMRDNVYDEMKSWWTP